MKVPSVATEKQKLLFRYGLKHPYSLLCADMRLGKSAVAVWLQQARKADTLIVCPSYLVSNWKKEINKWSPNSHVTVIRKGKDIHVPWFSDFCVISYDLATKAEALFDWAEMVISDESQHLKSLKAKKTQFFHKALYENSVKYFHGLTGTPIKNRVDEFYSLMALTYYDPRLDKEGAKFLEAYPDAITFAERFSFRQSYEVLVKAKNGAEFQMPVVKYVGLRNAKELKSWLKGRYIRVRADSADLPPLSYKNVLISDTPNLKLLAAFTAFFDRPGNDSVRPDVKVKAALEKVPFTIKYTEDLLESAECVLIYSDHRDAVRQIAKHFGVTPITGEVSGLNRAKLVADFQAGKGRVLCATIGSLKEGADLYRAKDLVLNDLSWVPGDMDQVVNRMRALGEKEPRVVHNILGSPQDEKILEALEEKRKVIQAAT